MLQILLRRVLSQFRWVELNGFVYANVSERGLDDGEADLRRHFGTVNVTLGLHGAFVESGNILSRSTISISMSRVLDVASLL